MQCNVLFSFSYACGTRKNICEKKLERTCSNKRRKFHQYTLTEMRLLTVRQGYLILQDTLTHEINMIHTEISNWIPPRTKSHFNSFMSSSVKLEHIPRLKSICTFMMYDHIGCTWFHLSYHMENPIPHGFQILLMYHGIHISYT